MYRVGIIAFLSLLIPELLHGQQGAPTDSLRLNAEGYFERHGFNVMVFDDFYPEGHQSGLTIIQAGERVAANGDVRFEATPGQWSPIPVVRKRSIDKNDQSIAVELSYPDSSRNRKGFNPIEYPDLSFTYTVRAHADGSGIRVVVDLDQPLPPSWGGKLGLNLELFPGGLFGEHYMMDDRTGIFPRQADGPTTKAADGTLLPVPMAAGHTLIVAPGEMNKELRIESKSSGLQLYDGRDLYNNGWFVVRSTIPAGVTKEAVVWVIDGKVSKGWTSTPTVHVSQVGYRPRDAKMAVIELDRSTETYSPVELVKVDANGEHVVLSDQQPHLWGTFLRYHYLQFDFSGATTPGLYRVRYGSEESQEFEIKDDVFARDVWQPTLEYFLPVQMCHMKVTDRYKTWHGLCHMDDATMAPVNRDLFDGYTQGNSTLTSFQPGDHIPGVNVGGWHDAGDYDIRVESQAETVYKLALAYEMWKIDFDETTVDQSLHLVRIHVPDGTPDIIQQIEHGVLSLVGAYESMGRMYHGIIEPTLQQYVHLGDASTITDNLVYQNGGVDPVLHQPLPHDDRLLFTEQNPNHELLCSQALAAASRVLRDANPPLAVKCLRIAEELWNRDSSQRSAAMINATAELYLTTSGEKYKNAILSNDTLFLKRAPMCAVVLGRLVKALNDPGLTSKVRDAVKATYARVAQMERENPFGVPYRPHIWGAGWEIQAFGVAALFLHLGFPDLVPMTYARNALNFVLGVHPGSNTASFASGIGVHSLTVAYGANRDDWSYIPGGIASGTALIRPDLPELKRWPYFWQQGEYVLGGGTADYLLLAIAADKDQ